MAIRSATTGPLVALVVFVILTVLSLVGAILFFTEARKHEAAANDSKRALAEVVSIGFLDQEPGLTVRQAAEGESKNVVEYLVGRNTELASLVTGETSTDVASIRTSLALQEGQTVKIALEDARRGAVDAAIKVTALEEQVKACEAETAALTAQHEAAAKVQAEMNQALEATIAPYRGAHETALVEIAELKKELEDARAQASTEYANQLATEQQRQTELTSENANLSGLVRELRQQLEGFRIKPSDPAMLVDGQIVDLAAAKDQVFISLGSKDRIRPGMTFEVYADPSAIMYDPRTDRQTPGYASIEVIKVGDTTSTARITRINQRKSIGKGDVLANAVYSPTYQYKFLVHGKFDVDGDGKPSKGEADFISQKIRDWGGIVVQGDQITPDLDFVVIGSIPPAVQVRGQSGDEGDAEYAASLTKSRAYAAYEALVASASAAQIPILNWNRFQILTGAAER